MADRVLQVSFIGDSSKLGSTVDGIGSKFSGLKVAAAAGGVAAGAAITSGIASTLSFDAAQKKLEAQLGGASELSKDAGEVAGSLYSHAYGENLGQVNDAVRSVVQSGALMEDASKSQIEGITASAMSLAQAFDIDVSESMRAVGQMVRTGLVPDATAGMDLITRAFQQFGPQANDVLDTVTEYSTQFRKLGIDGPQAMGLISQGLQAGARDTDTIADSLKEFSIRAIDGSKTTGEGFKAIGLNADDMAKRIAAGGSSANAAFTLTIEKLREMKDPVAQQAAAVALFGTKAEDLGAALFALDPSHAVAALGEVTGSASKLDATLGDTAQAKVTAMQRSWEAWSMSLVSVNGPLGTAAAGVLAFGDSTLSMAGNLSMVAVAFGPFSGQIWGLVTTVASATGSMIVSVVTWGTTMVVQGATAAASMAVNVARMVAGWALLGAQSLLRAAQVAAAWFIAMGPIGWAIAAVVGIVALIIANWDRVKAFTIGAWNAISGAVAGAIGGILGFFGRLPGQIIGALGNLGGLLYGAGSAIVQGLWNGISALGGWLKSKILGFIRSFVPGPVLQYLGIASPSKLFASIGRQIPAGMIQGIESQSDGVRKAMLEMSSGAPMTMLNTGVSALTPAPSGGIASAGSGALKLVIDSAGSALDDVLLQVLRQALRDKGLGGLLG